MTKSFKESWDLHKALSLTPAADEIENIPIPPAKDKTPVKGGQIRLMAGMVGFNWVLVMRSWGKDTWVVMPYSWLDVPGDAEFRSAYEGPWGRKVLQVWNTMTLAAETLEVCPVWDEAPEEAVKEAWGTWAYSLTGKELPGWIMPDIGSADPESFDEYQSEVFKTWAEVSAKDLALQLGEEEAE